MEQKFSDVYRTSFLTLDRYLQQSNSAQFYFRPLLPPLNTATGEFYSLSPAQGTDPSIRINKYSSNGTFLGFGYLYDTSFNVPPDTSGGGGGTNYWTLTGSNIYNNNPGFVGIGTTAPAYPLQVVQPIDAPGLNVVTAGAQGIRVTQSMMDTFKPAEIYFNKNAFLPSVAPPGAVGIDTYIPRGMFIFYNGQDRINITPDGFVGINTTPVPATVELEVSGTLLSGMHHPRADATYDLGNDSLRWRNLKVSDTIWSGNHLPQTSSLYDLGGTSNYWRNLYLSTGTIYMGPTATIGADGAGNVLVNKSNGKGLGININDQSVPDGFALDVSGRSLFGSLSDAGRVLLLPQTNYTYLQTSAPNGLNITPIGLGDPTLYVNTTTDQVGVNTNAPGAALGIYGDLSGNGRLLWYGGPTNINGTATFSGPVGINRNPPAAMLDVLGDISASGPIASSADLVPRVKSFALPVNVSDTDTSFNVDVTALPYSVYLVTIEASIVTSLGSDIALCIVDISNNVDTQLTKTYPIYAAVIAGNSVGAPFTSTTPINKGTGIIKVILRVTDENGNPGGGTFFNNSFVYLNIIGLC